MFILLVCNAGMSTSLIVNQMKKCIREQGKDYEIKAVALDSAYEYYDTADVILLGRRFPSTSTMFVSSPINRLP